MIQQGVSDLLAEVARKVLIEFPDKCGKSTKSETDRALVRILDVCTSGSDGETAAKEICRRFLQAIENKQVTPFSYPALLAALASCCPTTFLDVFLGDNHLQDYQLRQMFRDTSKTQGNPMSQFTDDDIITWCNEYPRSRYPRVACAIQAFGKSEETGKYEWKPIVYRIFKNATDVNNILAHLEAALLPMAWTGSLASALEERGVLFQCLYQHNSVAIRDWARNQYILLQERIKMERESENMWNRDRNERFE